MPFDIRPAGEEFEVYNKETGDVKGTHPTRAEAEDQMKALYANVDDASKVAAPVEGAPEMPSKPTGDTERHGEEQEGQEDASFQENAPDVTEETLPDPNSLQKMDLFVPLTKIDEKNHRIYAVGAGEEYDTNKEIMDFESSVPVMEAWSNAAYRRSGGRSYGNVREMHKGSAAGKLFLFKTNPAQKRFDIGIDVVDPLAWEKVRTGTYTGISIGGNYKRRWPDPYRPGYTRYTPDPVEFSLVDVPCQPSSVIEFTKMDGSTVTMARKDLHIMPDKKLGEQGATELQKQLPSAPAATGEVPVPDEHVQRMPAPSSNLELNPNSAPTGADLEQHHSAATTVIDLAAAAIQSTPPQGVRKVAITKQLRKQDSAVDSARSIMGQVLEQAKNGEIEEDTLSQLAAALDVSLDEASDNAANSGEATGTPQSTEEVTKTDGTLPTPSSGSSPSGTLPTPSTPSGSTPSGSSPSSPSLSKGQNMTPNQPLSTTPPMPNLILHGDDEEDEARDLPEFMSALSRGKLAKAQKIAGGQMQFDRMVLASCMQIMNEFGVNKHSMQKMAMGAPEQLDLQKAGMVASDVPGVWLMKLARLMLPLYAGIRRRLPVQTPQMGSNQATWRAMLGFSNVVFADMMSVAEAETGDAMNESFLTFNSPYRDIAQNDSVTLKAIAASRGYDDPMQIAVIRTLTAVLQGEERKIIGDNYAAISAPGTVTAAAAAGGSLPAATYTVKVSALTYRGNLAGTKGGGVGETAVTAAQGVVISGSPLTSVTASWASVAGAWAYNVYVSNGTNERFSKKVTVPTATITTFPASGSEGPTSDGSANTYGFEGIGQWSMLSSVYSQTITGKLGPYDLAGAGFTAADGGIPELDVPLSDLWTYWQIAPSLLMVSPKGIQTITGKLLSLNNAALYRIEVQEERGTIRGGAFVTGYVNKFAAYADGTPRYIDIMPHPYVPDGTALMLCESIPYPMSREARGWALDVLLPYTYFPLAQTKISYPFALTLSETVECFHPSVQIALQGIDWTK